jgi:ribosomal protein L10
MNEANLGIVEFYLGDFIDDVILKYNYPLDFEDEYDTLLKFIYKTIVSVVFKGKDPSPEELEKKLKNFRKRHKDKLEVLISYLVSRYINNFEEEVISRIRSRKKGE